ncbi:esterase/lipase family protein [Microbacterium sp. DT81.1]|uniref:esterase/lipase family protein n=1 Tax=Microbacterium sp. DT81.1 TaxID=3393413 RepID=UPI003CF99A3A
MSITQGSTSKPTVVLVHGAFAESSSWSGVITLLRNEGYPAIAVANPLRGVAFDSDYLRATLADISGDIVLVSHSYGGTVISGGGAGNANVKALVYIGAFARRKVKRPETWTASCPVRRSRKHSRRCLCLAEGLTCTSSRTSTMRSSQRIRPPRSPR